MFQGKNVFWEALVLTVAVFVIGIFLGISFEESKLKEINQYYALSEISLIDSLALGNMADLNGSSCETLVSYNVKFADRIYQEAFLLEKYESSGKLSDAFLLAHQRYDLLRTLLWINTMKTKEKCREEFSIVVYLYEFKTEDLNKRAEQNVWSRILFDLKQKRGNEILLIPIAVDSNLASLNSLLEKYEIEDFPVVIIDDEVISELSSVEELENYLD